jgi:hypothetical protein
MSVIAIFHQLRRLPQGGGLSNFRFADYWGVDTVFAKRCGVTRDPWGLVLTRSSRPAEGCVLLKCRVPRAAHVRARVRAEECEVVASASGIMFSRAIGLPENMLQTASGLEQLLTSKSAAVLYSSLPVATAARPIPHRRVDGRPHVEKRSQWQQG